jgi:hypothetical protein
MCSSAVTKVSKKRQVRRAIKRRNRVSASEAGWWVDASDGRLAHRAMAGDNSQRMRNGTAIGHELGATHATRTAAPVPRVTPPAICR